MKRNGMAWLLALVMGVLLPGVIFSVAERALPDKVPEPTEETTGEIVDTTKQPTQPADLITVQLADGTACEMEMDGYLTGVVLGELPADFHEEAIKAQAVVARTYALKRNTTGKKHDSGGVCTDAACCQAYCSIEEYIASGGLQSTVNKAAKAVADTKRQVLTYNGALIDATYFSCSGGRTEDALAVWGTDIPYLQAVDSPGEESAVHYTDEVKFSVQSFANLLGISPGTNGIHLGRVTYTQGGGVATMAINGRVFSGTVLRQKLGLRSTVFTMRTQGNLVFVTTKGFGHRVGMSQYGAEAMAAKGSSYRQILSHYYAGTTLITYP